MSRLTKEECLNALDYLFDNALDNDYMSILDSKMYDILEQLINEHFELKKERNRLYVAVGNLREVYNTLSVEFSKYEKALDKACEELSRLNNDLDRRVITTSTYWKEYLLKEVQENE